MFTQLWFKETEIVFAFSVHSHRVSERQAHWQRQWTVCHIYTKRKFKRNRHRLPAARLHKKRRPKHCLLSCDAKGKKRLKELALASHIQKLLFSTPLQHMHGQNVCMCNKLSVVRLIKRLNCDLTHFFSTILESDVKTEMFNRSNYHTAVCYEKSKNSNV